MSEFEPIDERIVISAFFDFMRKNGIYPRDNLTLITDGKIHRFSTQNDKHGGEAGAYFLHVDGCPNGGAMDYHIHSEMQKFKLDKDLIPRRPVMSREEYERMKADNERKKQENIKRQEEKYRLAAINAYAEFNSALPLAYPESHSYLIHKNVHNFNSCDIKLRIKQKKADNDICNVGDLLIPILDAANDEFISLINISENSPHKKFNYKNARITGGCVQLIPDGLRDWFCFKTDNTIILPEINSDITYVCEGIATGYAFLEIIEHKYPVLCAGGCNNLIHVCKAWHERYPEMKIFIAADNDDAGIAAAEKTKHEGYALNYTKPPVKNMDFNDWLNLLKGFNNHE